jgi:ribonuclease HI
MLFLNSRVIAASNGQYGDRADQNLAELRAILKGLIIRERKQSTQAEAEVSSSAAPLTTWSSTS